VQGVLDGWNVEHAVSKIETSDARRDLPLLASALWAAGPAGAEFALGLIAARAEDAERGRAEADEDRARDQELAETRRRADVARIDAHADAARLSGELQKERHARRAHDDSAVADVQAARREIDELAAQLERARAAIDEERLRARKPPTSVQESAPRARKRPWATRARPALPPGVVAHSRAGIEAMLRIDDVLLIVDGTTSPSEHGRTPRLPTNVSVSASP
jgi:hypothetical protein